MHSWVNKGRQGALSGISTYNTDLGGLETQGLQDLIRTLVHRHIGGLENLTYAVRTNKRILKIP